MPVRSAPCHLGASSEAHCDLLQCNVVCAAATFVSAACMLCDEHPLSCVRKARDAPLKHVCVCVCVCVCTKGCLLFQLHGVACRDGSAEQICIRHYVFASAVPFSFVHVCMLYCTCINVRSSSEEASPYLHNPTLTAREKTRENHAL